MSYKVLLSYSINVLLASSLLLMFQSCKTKGCTDPKANNFIYEAEKDDGSCDYGGCTDPDALNYNPDAQYNNGTCNYNGEIRIITTRTQLGGNRALVVHVNGAYVGTLSGNCTILYPNCNTNCPNLPFLDKPGGSYSLRFWEVRFTSSTTADTLYESSPQNLQVIGAECNIHIIE